jgi:ATP/maltotriose-dependent transcriptional regulator MalT
MGLHNVAALANLVLGICAARQGRLDEAIAMERQAATELAAQGDRRLEGTSRRILAQLLVERGAGAEAEREAATAVEILVAIPPSQVAALAALADARLATGQVGPALAAARAALALLIELGSVAEGDAYTHLVHARALAAAGDDEAAAAARATAAARLSAQADTISDPELRRAFLEDVPEHRALTAARSPAPP